MPAAHADLVGTTDAGAVVEGDGKRTTDGANGGGGGGGNGRPKKPPPTYLPKAEFEKRTAAWNARRAADVAWNLEHRNQWNDCVDSPTDEACGMYLADLRTLQDPLNIAVAGDPVPAIPPEVIAYQAVARLPLAPPKPVIGPPPELNRWKTAVVGYPLWLSVTGSPDPPAVSDRVFDVSVSLRAHLDRVVFDMGDGQKVSCTDTSHPWTHDVDVAERSKWCGYTYTEIPRGSKTYTVTAYAMWSVNWRINRTTGTLPLYQQTSVELPVSELQVLVR